jgi:hypothetical protein
MMFSAGVPPPLEFGWTGLDTNARKVNPLFVPPEEDFELLHEICAATTASTTIACEVLLKPEIFENIEG